jgi:hypothetical protein
LGQHIDILTLGLLGLQVFLYFTLSRKAARSFFLVYFAVWRLAYNAGLGYVLRKQSEQKWIVKTVVREGWMDAVRRPQVQRWVASELQAKMGKDYRFEVSAGSVWCPAVHEGLTACSGTRRPERTVGVQRKWTASVVTEWLCANMYVTGLDHVPPLCRRHSSQ